MERFEHGGDIYTHEGVLDYSANLNPQGIPASALAAVRNAIDHFDVYPDPACRELISAIARFEGVSENHAVPTAGATDAIARACSAIAEQGACGKVLVCAPCYSGYEQAIEQAGMEVARHTLREEEGFQVNASILASIDDTVGGVFLANPNNPTGLCLDHDLLVCVLETCRDMGIVVVLDECFIDLTQEKGSTPLLDVFPNLIIVKALTKTFALAGLRVGYALCSDAALIDRMRKAGQMWAVSTPAQVAGVAALEESDYVARGQELVAAERARLFAALEECGMRVVPGQANYLMFKDASAVACAPSPSSAVFNDKEPPAAAMGHAHTIEIPDSALDRTATHIEASRQDSAYALTPNSLYDALLARGILIRRCENYQGLSGSWFRIAVRTPQENDRFIAALKEVRA